VDEKIQVTFQPAFLGTIASYGVGMTGEKIAEKKGKGEERRRRGRGRGEG
jgi:hypothetical protein